MKKFPGFITWFTLQYWKGFARTLGAIVAIAFVDWLVLEWSILHAIANAGLAP